MPSDLTRTSDDVQQGYTSVLLQQGRVLLDRDFNALQETAHRALEADALDIIGPCGTPDDGFAITLPTTNPPNPPLWTPPPPLPAPGLPAYDFLIRPGTMYIGGQRAVFPGPGPDEADFTYSYFDQPDWIRPDDPLAATGDRRPVRPSHEYVYLRLFEQEVSAVEDPDLKDAALGGPDTTQRLRLMRRVERMRIESTTCAAALAEAQAAWLNRGFGFATRSNQLLPRIKLQAGFTQPLSTKDYCDPIAQGGYLGAENQLIRIQISNPAGAANPKLVWAYDNASFLYRVTQLDSQTLKLDRPPVDAFHDFFQGQVVEVLRTSSILADDPDATDPSGAAKILRCIAEPVGEFFTLDGPVKDGQITLQQALDSDPTEPQLFLRIWQGQADLDPASTAPIPLTDALGQTTGVQVTLTLPAGVTDPAALPDGTYWMLAVRPITPQAVYPERFLTAPQPPDGPLQWVCSLAVIDWTATQAGRFHPVKGSTGSLNEPVFRDAAREGLLQPVKGQPAGPLGVHDCREKFDNLVELTKRQGGGCCTVEIGPDDLGENQSLQDVLDSYSSQDRLAREVTICLLPGKYSLPAPLMLNASHSNFTIKACHDGVIFEAAAGAEANFLHGLVVLMHADNVTLRGLRFHLPLVPFARAGGTIGGASLKVTEALKLNVFRELLVSIGVRTFHCAQFKLEDCLFRFPLPSQAQEGSAARLTAYGLLAGSECWGLTVERCRFVRDDDYLARAATQEATLPSQRLVGFALSSVVQFGPSEGLANRMLSGAFAPALLQDALFRDNLFAGLAIAGMVDADLGAVRLESNVVRGCTYGFSLATLDASAGLRLVEAAARVTGFLNEQSQQSADAVALAASDEILLNARAMASAYPLPGTSQPGDLAKVSTPETSAQAAAGLQSVASLLTQLTGSQFNHLKTQPKAAAPQTPASPAAEASAAKATRVISDHKLAGSVTRAFTVKAGFPAAMVVDALAGQLFRQGLRQPKFHARLQPAIQVCGNQFEVTASALRVWGPAASLYRSARRQVESFPPEVIVQGNRMQTVLDFQGFAADLLFVGCCVVSGNIILHPQVEANFARGSLRVWPLPNLNKVPPVAVTGNVLQGSSNLNTLITGQPAPVDTWVYANAPG